MAKVLLKARPTIAQLADRLREPWAGGLELYLDASDISGDGWEKRLVDNLAQFAVPPGFSWVVEGPLRSLDGTFFDITVDSPANREVLRRLAGVGKRIGAEMAVIHVISPTPSAADFSGAKHDEMIEQSVPILVHYRDLCSEAGMVPTIENMPPVTRMRESRIMHSIVGMEPGDLIFLGNAVEGLRFTLDVSHAQLYINARCASAVEVGEPLEALVEYLSGRPLVASIDDYITLLEDRIAEAHFSNARGIMEEGMPYDDGDLDLDRVAARLGSSVRFLVTETIEPDPDRADLMRDAQARIAQALGSKDSSTKRGIYR